MNTSSILIPILPKEKDRHYRILLSNHLTIYIPNDRNHTHWEDMPTYGWHALYARARRTRIYKELPFHKINIPPTLLPHFFRIISPTGILLPIQY